MNNTNCLPAQEVEEVASCFRRSVPDIFAEEFIFGFIFGGFAKGYATRNHDIDMFVCLRSLTPERVQAFRNWYYKIHSEFGLPPDDLYPGELITAEFLDEKIKFVEARPLRREVETLYEYEAILWGDALSGPKLGVAGDESRLLLLEDRCKRLAKRWRLEAASLIEGDEFLDNLDLRRLFKKMGIVYRKRGNNVAPEN